MRSGSPRAHVKICLLKPVNRWLVGGSGYVTMACTELKQESVDADADRYGSGEREGDNGK